MYHKYIAYILAYIYISISICIYICTRAPYNMIIHYELWEIVSQHVSLFFFLVSRIWCVKFPAHPSELPRHLKLLLLEYDQRQLSDLEQWKHQLAVVFQDVVMEIISVFVYEGCRSQRLCIYIHIKVTIMHGISMFCWWTCSSSCWSLLPRSLRLILAKKFFSGTAALGEPSWHNTATAHNGMDSTDSPRGASLPLTRAMVSLLGIKPMMRSLVIFFPWFCRLTRKFLTNMTWVLGMM